LTRQAENTPDGISPDGMPESGDFEIRRCLPEGCSKAFVEIVERIGLFLVLAGFASLRR
jgi:hypothetical protein